MQNEQQVIDAINAAVPADVAAAAPAPAAAPAAIPVAATAEPLRCKAYRYSWRMKGVGALWANSRASQAAASTSRGESTTRMT